MVTKMIGVKDFRQNMAQYAVSARRNGWAYIVLSRNEPIFEVNPISAKNRRGINKLAQDIAHARKQVREGKTRALDDVMREMGL